MRPSPPIVAPAGGWPVHVLVNGPPIEVGGRAWSDDMETHVTDAELVALDAAREQNLLHFELGREGIGPLGAARWPLPVALRPLQMPGEPPPGPYATSITQAARRALRAR